MEIPMSAIPYPLDPMGSSLGPYFTLVVKPGILGDSLTYGFTPYWNTGGYCKVMDYGVQYAGTGRIKLELYLYGV